MVTETEVRAVIQSVIHPSFGMSLSALGMIRAVRVDPAGIEIELVMNCAGCPGPQMALDSLRHAIRTLDGEIPIKITLLPEVWHPPWEGL
ncbi:MAG: hypothetical protein Kow0077_15670 [Anaerolineae bacterium]